MKKEPIISVIVPVYNRSQYLRRCVKSILKQTFSDLEVILIDDGSTDGSSAICDGLGNIDKRIRVLHQTNSGPSYSRNVGIEIAKGKYIGFVDADDWISLEMYRILYDNITLFDADICTVKYLVTNQEEIEDNAIDSTAKVEILSGIDKLRRYLEIGISDRSNLYSPCTKLYKKSMFEKIRFPEGQLFEDMATNYRMIDKANKFVIVDRKLYYYYMNSTGTTRNRCKNSDLDLIKTTKEIYEMTKETEIEILGKIVYGRSFYSLLIKYILYGVDDVINERNFVRKIHEGYCRYFFILIRSNMPLTRRIVMPILWIAPFLMRKIVGVLRKNA